MFLSAREISFLLSSSSMKFCNLPTEPLSFLKKYKTQYPSSPCPIQFWVVETSGVNLETSRITSQFHQEILIRYLIFSLLPFTCVRLMDISWFSYLVPKILCGVWFCFSYYKHQVFPLDVDRRDWVIFLLNGFCWQDGFRLLTKLTPWAWWPKALLECVLLAGQIEMVVTKCKQPNPFHW